MKDYLTNYIKETDKLIKKKKITKKTKEEHLIKIDFFKHERLIHLLVTLFYGIYTFVFLYFSTIYSMFVIIFFILLVILLFYVVHYFRLENGVQYLYKQYDQMNDILGEK